MVFRSAFLGLFLMLGGSGSALAAESFGREGRFTYTEGTVTLRLPDRPIVSGQSVVTHPGARAEIALGATDLRVNESSELEIARLDARTQLLVLHRGTVAVRQGPVPGSNLRLDTPRGVLSVPKPGSYRIDVDDGTMIATVIEGELHLEEIGGAHIVRTGESVRVSGHPRRIEFDEARMTTFDLWVRDRERRVIASGTVSEVVPETVVYPNPGGYAVWHDPEPGVLWIERSPSILALSIFRTERTIVRTDQRHHLQHVARRDHHREARPQRHREAGRHPRGSRRFDHREPPKIERRSVPRRGLQLEAKHKPDKRDKHARRRDDRRG